MQRRAANTAGLQAVLGIFQRTFTRPKALSEACPELLRVHLQQRGGRSRHWAQPDNWQRVPSLLPIAVHCSFLPLTFLRCTSTPVPCWGGISRKHIFFQNLMPGLDAVVRDKLERALQIVYKLKTSLLKLDLWRDATTLHLQAVGHIGGPNERSAARESTRKTAALLQAFLAWKRLKS